MNDREIIVEAEKCEILLTTALRGFCATAGIEVGKIDVNIRMTGGVKLNSSIWINGVDIELDLSKEEDDAPGP